MNQVTREWQDAVLMAFENQVFYWDQDDRWYSRDPKTTQWQNDRMRGRRFHIVNQMLPTMEAEIRKLPVAEQRIVRQLSNRQTRYGFLAELAPRYWGAPVPADWGTNREGI